MSTAAAPGSRHRVRAKVVCSAAVLGLVAALIAVGLRVGRDADGAAVSARPAPPGALPELGRAQVVDRDDVGDPFILPVPAGIPGDRADRYVLFWTTDWQSNVPTAVSPDMVHWHRIADSLPVLPSWALPNRTMTWGPSAVAVPGGWVLYFSTEAAASHLECIGAAFSQNPAGPYVDASPAPLVCQPPLGGSIDPSVVRDAAGGLHLVWKTDGNATGAPVNIWEEQLTANGQSMTGQPVRLLGPDRAWQQGIIEGPAMLADTRGGWWLFYSGGTWQSNTYDTGVAWCAALSGPCRDTSDGPLLGSTPTAVSPGGLDTFVANNGTLWASYSAFPSAPANARAAMAEDRVLEIAPVLSH